MKFARRALAAALLPLSAAAQPARSVRLIAPYPPGGGVDTSARLLAVPMAAALG